MNLLFKKVILHNFLSYQHSEIDLRDRQYCLVSGINNCKLDNAVSNGSGKSTFTSAICWALTGETIQGIKSNLKNKYVDEKLAYVTLEFNADCNEYVISRFIEPKSDLKIYKNGDDISGKGIRESELILAQNLPDLNSNLIASIIILGQGLPSKFSSNSPSGRKEVLERLSKSDFMIEDIKKRINNRLIELNTEKRSFEDALLTAESQKGIYDGQLKQKTAEYETLKQPHNFDETIKELNEQITKLNETILNHNQTISECNAKNTELNKDYTAILESKNKVVAEENNEFNSYQTGYYEKKSDLTSKIKVLNESITKAKNIKDVCPTCGRPFEGVHKPDTKEEEAALSALNEELSNLNIKYTENLKIHSMSLKDIENAHSKDITDKSLEIKKVKDKLDLYTNDLKIKNRDLLQAQTSLGKILVEKENYESKLKELEEVVSGLQNSIQKLQEKILYNNNERESVVNHINIINQMNTLVKRDFRGFLLSNVISFINTKAKEYSTQLFGTNQLDFVLDGNNIDISYCDKAFENLSGGEKQKVDLIIQFAIRDMMQQYLGFSSNILVLDEVFDNLDATATESVINLIANKLNDIESVYIISHHADSLGIPYDTEMVVIKDENGISRIK